jgi:N-acetylmuramoyl-L-alanine amidase
MATIWLDPGHGGGDGGAGSMARWEKDDNLRLGLAVSRCLKAMGHQTVMTREGDVYLTLAQRTALENAVPCDAAISLHRNGAESPGANGVEIWLHAQAPESYLHWAENILADFQALGFRNRGAKTGYRTDPTANYAVNRDTKAPSMLIEAGFITNAGDNALFDDHLEAMAQSIAAQTLRFLGLYEPSDSEEKTPLTLTAALDKLARIRAIMEEG